MTAIGVTLLALLACGALAGILAPAGAYGDRRPRPAHMARALNATDTAHLHYKKSPGSLLLEEGPVSGTLPGKLLARFDVGPTITAYFTIYPRGGGSISGRGEGKLKGSPAEPSFGGTMLVTAGTGRYSHVHGRGGFYGTFNRRTYALTVQTTGALSY